MENLDNKNIGMNRQNPTLVGSDAWKEMEEKNPKLALVATY